MSGWIPREPPEYQDDYDLFEMFINGDLIYEPPIEMPTNWLVEVRAMCRTVPFRLGGDYVVRQIEKCH